jgi:GTPase
LIDLPGNPKYFKTTFSGITSNLPDYVLIVMSAVDDKDETMMYIEMCKSFNINYKIIN